MRTVKRKPFLAGVCAVLGGVALCGGVASADVVSDQTAGLVIYPDLEADFCSGVDTEIQLTNTSNEAIKVRCFYVNANSHCTNRPDLTCNTTEDCQGSRIIPSQEGPTCLFPTAPEELGRGGICEEGWHEIDFEFTLTPYQPIAWLLSEGRQFLPLDGFPIAGNEGSIPAANEDPFHGELKCFQVGPDDRPIDRNDLKGEATIVTAPRSDLSTTANNPTFSGLASRIAANGLDARSYNAIGIQAIEGANNGDNVLEIGNDAEYNGCPAVLILDHYFDDAIIDYPDMDRVVRTNLTLAPCSQNFLLQEQALFDTTVQFLVYNEFEQRFSASRKVRCLKEFGLTDIGLGRDRPFGNDVATNNDQRSIFNVYVQGTITGQTRIRGVDDGEEGHGNGLIGTAEEFYRSDRADLRSVVGTAAVNIHQVPGNRPPDSIIVP